MGESSTMECAALKDFSETIANAWRNALKALHRRGFSAAGLAPEAIADPGVLPLIDATASALDSAISRTPLSDAMRQRLSESNYIFSGLKTFHSLNEAFPAMVDSDGNLKPFEQFLNDVQKIERQYNVNYLRAEYNFAVASAQSAARWEQTAADGDRYDLQYRTASDSRVRPEHAALHGVTLPPSSPFWDSFMPPNGWNCRCTVVQVRKGKYPHTDVAEAIERGERATIRDTRGMMRFNPGKLGKTFPDYNPYTIRRCRDCDLASGTSTLARTSPPDSSLCQACQILRSYENGFIYVPTIKGIVRVHSEHGEKEKEENIAVAKYFAEKYGHEIDLLPNPNNVVSADAFNKTLGHKEEYKVNSTATKSAIDNEVRDAAKQSDYIVLRIDSDIDLVTLSRGIRGRVNWCKSLKEVTIIRNGMDVRLSRNQIMGNHFEIKSEDFK